LDGESAAEAMKQDLANKKVASLIERYESQESVQRAWEQDYFIKQNSVRTMLFTQFLDSLACLLQNIAFFCIIN
jgi:hypothetical protein